MQPDVKRAVVLGGTGAVGAAVLQELARRGVPATFTYLSSADKAKVLALEYGHTGLQVDLADPVATRAALDRLETPAILIHCAGISASLALDEIDLATWNRALAVNTTAAFVATQWLASRNQPADIVLVGGLDRAQSLPLPVHFAASQGALSALVMALGHELGPRGVRVNLVALGPLSGGISSGLVARRRKDFETFSSLRRVGTPEEAARAICWLALENTFIQGKVIPVNGGI